MLNPQVFCSHLSGLADSLQLLPSSEGKAVCPPWLFPHQSTPTTNAVNSNGRYQSSLSTVVRGRREISRSHRLTGELLLCWYSWAAFPLHLLAQQKWIPGHAGATCECLVPSLFSKPLRIFKRKPSPPSMEEAESHLPCLASCGPYLGRGPSASLSSKWLEVNGIPWKVLLWVIFPQLEECAHCTLLRLRNYYWRYSAHTYPIGPNFIDEQRAKQQVKSVTRKLKLSCSVWEHCADPPMFALRISLMVLN